ncbi:DUF6415 family natural product biosynthesis protein [Streptomyces sp. NPDC047000]|uniref:DUF6415 family natural product biosynthesis protein n=1 Tax=Streptomyces sp. NPDC047000 TaxID=3155474 RepID=UPI0033EA82D1
MRETARLLLGTDAASGCVPLVAGELALLTDKLHGHLAVLVPVVERTVSCVETGGGNVSAARGCVWEARSRLVAEPSARTGGAVGHARRLARVLVALCGHYETLVGN